MIFVRRCLRHCRCCVKLQGTWKNMSRRLGLYTAWFLQKIHPPEGDRLQSALGHGAARTWDAHSQS
jgi:hypothetical protein